MSSLIKLLGLHIEKPEYRRLWWQIMITIIAFSVLPLVLLGAVIYFQFSASYNAAITDNLKTLAENRRSALDLFFDERVAQLVTLANTHSLDRLQNEEYLNRVFNIMQTKSRSFLDLGVIDQEGNHLAYVGPGPFYSVLKGVNYKNEDWFHAAMSSGIYISDVFLGFRKVPHFIIAVVVREGQKNWILRATIDSNIIEDLVRAAQTGKRGDAFIVNRQNILQTTPRFFGKLLERPQCPDGLPCPDFAAAVGTRVEQVGDGKAERLMGTSVLQSKRWVLVIMEDPGEQLTPLLQARLYTLAIGAAGVLLIILGSVFTTRSMMRELLEMERKKAVSEDLAIQSSKMAALGKMAAGIAHEINNPLAVIGEKAGWMKDLLKKEDLAQSKNFQEFADSVVKIEYHISRAKKITHRLLSFGRRMEPVTERVDVNRVINETIDFLENEARYRNIDIQTDLASDLPQITSDSSQLQQVFLNIINNAIDAIGKNGLITVKSFYIVAKERVGVAIADNGPGMPKEVVGRIFDPFFTTKEVGKGTGLGLSISYSIVEKLGGQMMVASEEGKGTTFTVYLPAGGVITPT